MAAPAKVQNPPVAAESKSSKKKKAKAEPVESPVPTASPAPEPTPSVGGQDGEETFDTPLIKETQR